MAQLWEWIVNQPNNKYLIDPADSAKIGNVLEYRLDVGTGVEFWVEVRNRVIWDAGMNFFNGK